jgi:sigma-54 dependent transcriptional regulator, acetoin dehydrogenase operon transcriptional activator AcoR
MQDRIFEKLLSDSRNMVRILDNLKEGIIAHDMSRRIFFFNHAAEKITGYDRKDVLYKDCREAFGSPFCGERCLFVTSMDENSRKMLLDDVEYPVRIMTKDGETRNVEMSVNPLLDENGNIVGVLSLIQDITELLRYKIKTGETSGFSNIIGQDHKMFEVFQQIRDLSAYDYPVHIYGETGTGKELVAEAIHNESRRSGTPFVPINCGALPSGLIESELFGHAKGSFTGAIKDKKGRFELADGGSLFLDEVAELSKDLQVKLLRFLQTGKFERVGGEHTISVNVRIISATNKDLDEAVKNGSFREDLYYRLNVIPIHLPPLRERKNDIPLLIEYFMNLYSPGATDAAPRIVSKEAMSLLMDYHWPGNVRQLQNVLQFAIVKSAGKIIRPSHLPMELRDSPEIRPGTGRGHSRKLDEKSVRMALEKTGGNKVRAARLLGVGRATLYRFLSDHPESVPEMV